MKRIAAVAAAVALVAFAPSPASAHQTDILMVGFKFHPPVAVADFGHPVVWRNIEPAPIPHNVVVVAYTPPQGTPELGTRPATCPLTEPNGSCSRSDLARGTYVYTCTVDAIHTATMQGVLIVQ